MERKENIGLGYILKVFQLAEDIVREEELQYNICLSFGLPIALLHLQTVL